MTTMLDFFPSQELILLRSKALIGYQTQMQGLWEGLPLPTSKEEDWKYFPLTPLREATYAISPKPIQHSEKSIVFTNGLLTSCPKLPQGVKLQPRVTISREVTELDNNYFYLFNQAFCSEAYEIIVEPGIILPDPMEIIFRHNGDDALTILSLPFLTLRLGEGSVLHFIERHEGDLQYLSSGHTDIFLAPHSSLEHDRIYMDSSRSFQFTSLRASLSPHSSYKVRTIGFDARLRRDCPHVLLGEGAHAEVDGLMLLGNHQVGDTHSFIHHQFPQATSRQLQKCIMADQSKGIFNGQIRVALDAQLTDAQQQSRNLLLSEQASVDTKPQLEIYADDVKCSHGATIGQLNDDEIFYLQTRGLDYDAARGLLTYGFASELIGRIGAKALRPILRDKIMNVLGVMHLKETL